MVIAKTQHLVIREFTTEDIDSLYELYDSWAKGPGICFLEEMCPGMEGLCDDPDAEYEKMKSYIQWMYGFYGVGLYAVIEADSGRLIGRCGAWPAEHEDLWLLELGYLIHYDYVRKGYAKEAMRAILDYIREETEFEKAAAQIYEKNVASRRIAESLGMQLFRVKQRNQKNICLYMMNIH